MQEAISEPGAVATGSRRLTISLEESSSHTRLNPVATAPGSDAACRSPLFVQSPCAPSATYYLPIMAFYSAAAPPARVIGSTLEFCRLPPVQPESNNDHHRCSKFWDSGYRPGCAAPAYRYVQK